MSTLTIPAIVAPIITDTPLDAPFTPEYLEALDQLKTHVRTALTQEIRQVCDSRQGTYELRCRLAIPHTWVDKQGKTQHSFMRSGLYDVPTATTKLIDDILQRNVSERCQVYFCPQGLHSDTMTEYYKWHNQITSGHHAGAKDIEYVHVLAFDIDPITPFLPDDPTRHYKGSSDDEHENVLAVGRDIVGLWLAEGFPTPHMIDTGNGVQILIKVPRHQVFATRTKKNDQAEGRKDNTRNIYDAKTVEILMVFEQIFTIFRQMFTDRAVTFDPLSLGLSQGCRVPGTINWKGPNTPERPMRLATTIQVPERLPWVSNAPVPALGEVKPVEWEQLTAFVAKYADILQEAKAQQTPQPATHHQWTVAGCVDQVKNEKARQHNTTIVYELLTSMGIGFRLEPSRDDDLYILDTCPYRTMQGKADHEEREKSWVKVAESGEISASCFKADCKTYILNSGTGGWRLIRQLGDEDYAKKAEKREQKQRQEQLLDRIQEAVRQGATIREVEAVVVDPDEELLQGKAYSNQLNTILTTKNRNAVFEPAFLEMAEQLYRDAHREFCVLRKKIYEGLSTPEVPFDIYRFNKEIVRIKQEKDRKQHNTPGETPEDTTTTSLVPYSIPEGMEIDQQSKETFIETVLRSNMYLEQMIVTQCLSTDITTHNCMDFFKSYTASEGVNDKSLEVIGNYYKMMITPPKDYPLDIIEVVGRFPFTLLGNVMRVADFYKTQFRYCPDDDTWYEYKNGCWREDIRKTHTTHAFEKRLVDPTVELEMFKAMLLEGNVPLDHIQREAFRKKIIHHAYTNQNGAVTDTEISARNYPDFEVHPQDFDTQPRFFNVKNGTYNLSTGELQTHDPRDLLKKQAPVVYDQQAICPAWLRFIDHITQGEHQEEYRRFLQIIAGYFLLGDNPRKAFFILHGVTNTGKTSWTEVLQKLMGNYAHATPNKTVLDRDADASGNEIVDLQGYRFAYTSELSERQHLSESTVKMITGGGMITARANYKGYEEFYSRCKIAIDTNEIPRFNPADEALLDRMIPLPFEHPITQRIDAYVETVLVPELSGILNWALEGCRLYLQDGLQIPQFIIENREEVRGEKDRVLEFMNECCLRHVRAKVKAHELFTCYKQWCLEQNYTPMGSKTFYQRLKQQTDIKPIRESDANGYSGVTLKNNPTFIPL